MSDHPAKGSPIAIKDVRDRVDALALRILSALAARDPAAARAISVDHVHRLHAAALAPDRGAARAAIVAMRQAGIGTEEIADIYVPAVARLLGEEWCEDRIGFAAVTIGTSRLQSLLRDLGPEWRADCAPEGDAPAILVVVPSDVHHTLGPMILSGQLRRRGFSVRLLMGAGPEDMNLHLRQSQFDAVMISAARGDSVPAMRRLVDALRTAVAPGVRIVVGGTLVEAEPDLARLTGADLASCDLELALQHCGLSAAQRRGDSREAARDGGALPGPALRASRATDAEERGSDMGLNEGRGGGQARLTPVGRT